MGSTAVADKTNTNLTITKTLSEKINFSDMAQRFVDTVYINMGFMLFSELY